MSERPTPEAVEASIRVVRARRSIIEWLQEQYQFTRDHPIMDAVDALLSASKTITSEVEHLRAELDRRHKEYASALNRRVDVENTLAQFAAGKRDILSREEARELAVKLGVPPKPLPRPDKPGWLPIETAPMDGTRIVTAEQSDKGWWFNEDWWIADDIDDWQFASYPSYWMPLPPSTPPPAPEKGVAS